MYTNKVLKSWDTATQKEVADTVYGFNNVYNWNMSISASTKLYGFWIPNRKLFGDKIQAMVERASLRCGLESVSQRLIGNLSKGFRQRVGIAQAILHNPAVVILDEPTVGLDPIQIREIRSLIRELGKDHGIILSTHILPEVQAVCDRVQILNRGRTVFNNTLEGVQSLEQVFFDLIFREAELSESPEVNP